MKTTLIRFLLIVGTAIPALAQSHYTVHEWGTFTSVQGGDGRLLWWHPLATSQLPGFVNNWSHPGLYLIPTAMQGGGKGGFGAQQRLETPVVYFYSDKTMDADVSVGFPLGFVTEWYPLASQIGPSGTYSRAAPFQNQKFMSRADGSLADSRVTWRHLTLIPPGPGAAVLDARLPTDQAGSHYFAARETDSDFVQTDLPDPATGTNELEKFLFYRGAGTFATPLHAAMDAANRFEVGNDGAENLSHLFFVRVQDGYGEFACRETLPRGQTNWVDGWEAPGAGWQRFPLGQFKDAIAGKMAAALVQAGLFPREAQAMVNTWRDSWFSEDGTRVLYFLPRAWTDGVLPMTLNPPPGQLVRVMVGRAEVISPRVQTELQDDLTRASEGDLVAQHEASRAFKSLGRFAPTALGLVIGNDYTNAVAVLGTHLLIEASVSKN